MAMASPQRRASIAYLETKKLVRANSTQHSISDADGTCPQPPRITCGGKGERVRPKMCY